MYLFISTLSNAVQVKMTRMRMRTAERLKESQNTAAMLTTFNEVDMRFVIWQLLIFTFGFIALVLLLLLTVAFG